MYAGGSAMNRAQIPSLLLLALSSLLAAPLASWAVPDDWLPVNSADLAASLLCVSIVDEMLSSKDVMRFLTGADRVALSLADARVSHLDRIGMPLSSQLCS